MIEILSEIRTALISKLENLEYMDVAIPVDDENLTQEKAELPIGNSTGVQAYVVLQNQSIQDVSSKCCVNQNTQIQLDVTTEFMAGTGSNSGNYYHADKITGEILEILFPNCTNQIDLTLPNAQLWKGVFVSGFHLMSEFEHSRYYRNIVTLNFSVKQNPLTS